MLMKGVCKAALEPESSGHRACRGQEPGQGRRGCSGALVVTVLGNTLGKDTSSDGCSMVPCGYLHVPARAEGWKHLLTCKLSHLSLVLFGIAVEGRDPDIYGSCSI